MLTQIDTYRPLIITPPCLSGIRVLLRQAARAPLFVGEYLPARRDAKEAWDKI